MKIATAIIEPEEASTKVTTQTLATDVSALDTAVGQLDVNSQEAYSSMESMISQAKALKKRIKEHFEDHVEQAHRAWKGLTAARKAQIDPLDAVIEQGEHKLGGYIARMRQAEAEERAIAEAAAKREQDDGALVIAEQLEEQEGIEVALAYLKRSETTPMPKVESPKFAPRTAKGSTRTTWRFDIEDESQLPREYLLPDKKLIASVVKEKKERTSIPGVRAYPETKRIVR